MRIAPAFEKFRGEGQRELLVWLKRILFNNINDVVREYQGTAKRDVARESSRARSRSFAR
ncbi:MAG: hypothetical protein U1D30_22850 [Planctomycetota bacterium]